MLTIWQSLSICYKCISVLNTYYTTERVLWSFYEEKKDTLSLHIEFLWKNNFHCFYCVECASYFCLIMHPPKLSKPNYYCSSVAHWTLILHCHQNHAYVFLVYMSICHYMLLKVGSTCMLHNFLSVVER